MLHPSRLDRLQGALGIAALLAGLLALYVAFFASPAERFLGDLVRIVYVHFGVAMVSYLAFSITALASIAFLVRKTPGWDHLASASAEVGVVLTSLTLGTGMILGRGAQGWWWRWDDARLVLTLFMWFLFVAYLILRQLTEGERRAALSAVLAIVGIPTMVLNHLALTIFRQVAHPQSVILRPGGPAASEPILTPLLLSLLAFLFLYGWFLVLRLRIDRVREALMRLR